MPLLVIVSLLAMGLAQAAHIHKPDADAHDKATICALCLHGDHMADAPVLARHQTIYVSSVAAPPLFAAPRAEISSAPYHARGPPRF